MKNLKFKKGEFITQNSCPDSFAIFGGTPYESYGPEDETVYSLICYFNPNHYEQDSNGNWVRESIFEYELDDDETCDYTISDGDMKYWRSCTQYEIIEALKMLANKRLAWDEKNHTFRALSQNEQIKFDNSMGINAQRTSPMYGGNQYHRQSQTSTTRSVKMITRTVKDNWEQKEPIATMDDERRVFIIGLCDKLKYAFSDYAYGSQRVYPTNGNDYPRRFGGMCGIDAYSELMNGEDWGWYD